MAGFLPPAGGIAQRMFAGRRPASSNEAYWRDKLANQGAIKKDNAPLVQKLQGKVASGLRAAGMDKHNANRLASKTLRALNDLTPVGNATMASDGAQQARRGYQKGSVWDAVAGGAQVGLAALPAAVSRPAKGLFGKGIRAWHGSPHDFDKFSLSKIGTGEGAQAYGHGLYFAENRGTAEAYQRQLGGYDIPNKDALPAKVLEDLTENGGDVAKTLEWYQRMAANPKSAVFPNSTHWQDNMAALQQAQVAPRGRLYEVNINAKPDEFLDYDAPIKDQPKALDALRALDLGKTQAMSRTRKMLEWAQEGVEQPHNLATGRELLNAVSNYGDARGPAEWDALMPHGLQGVRYLDQGSRGTGQGSRNLVVFDDSIIDILNKY